MDLPAVYKAPPAYGREKFADVIARESSRLRIIDGHPDPGQLATIAALELRPNTWRVKFQRLRLLHRSYFHACQAANRHQCGRSFFQRHELEFRGKNARDAVDDSSSAQQHLQADHPDVWRAGRTSTCPPRAGGQCALHPNVYGARWLPSAARADRHNALTEDVSVDHDWVDQ